MKNFFRRLRAAYYNFKYDMPLDTADYRGLLKAYMIQMEINVPLMQQGKQPPVNIGVSREQLTELQTLRNEVAEIYQQLKPMLDEDDEGEEVQKPSDFVSQSTHLH